MAWSIPKFGLNLDSKQLYMSLSLSLDYSLAETFHRPDRSSYVSVYTVYV